MEKKTQEQKKRVSDGALRQELTELRKKTAELKSQMKEVAAKKRVIYEKLRGEKNEQM